MLEICDTFVEPAVYKKYDKKLESYLQYRLIITPDPLNKNENSDIFSLLVIRLKKDLQYETKFIFDIARTREKAFVILSEMAENNVTPVCACDVAEDLILY